MTLKFYRLLEVVKLRVRTKLQQAECSGPRVIVSTSFFALSLNGEKFENSVLWPWPLTYDLEVLWVSGGCEDTYSCKISSR